MSVCNNCDNALFQDRSRCENCQAHGGAAWNDRRGECDEVAYRPFTVSIVRADGLDAREIPVAMGGIVLDAHAEIVPPGDDSAMERACIQISDVDGEIQVEEMGGDGVFLRVRGEHSLLLPCELRIGSHRCLLEELETGSDVPMPGFWGVPKGEAHARLTDILDGGVVGDTFILRQGQCTVGREEGGIVFYPTDGFVSGTHARFTVEGNSVTIADLNSSNGTFIRIGNKVQARNGDQFLMGHYLLKITMA